jgi:hypothetical protein
MFWVYGALWINRFNFVLLIFFYSGLDKRQRSIYFNENIFIIFLTYYEYRTF